MKYLLLSYSAEGAWAASEREGLIAESTALVRDLNQKDQLLAASPLQPVAKARSVRVRDGVPLVTDGPFAETREQLGGFYLIDVKDMDEALAIAARVPVARKGTVEVRPVVEVAGLPPLRQNS
jgi:hypothetical protein